MAAGLTAKLCLAAGAIAGLTAVALGAFGAHALRAQLDESAMSVYRTAVEYHFYHAVALTTVGALASLHPGARELAWAGGAFAVGIVVFSGSLYLLATTGTRWLGAVTPLGGLAFLAGWALLLVAALRHW